MRICGLDSGQRQALEHLVGHVIRAKNGTCRLALQKGGTLEGEGRQGCSLGPPCGVGSMRNPGQGLGLSTPGLGEGLQAKLAG